MKMRTDVQINDGAVHAIEQAMMRAAEKAIDATLTDVTAAQVMPFDTGDMQDNRTYTAFVEKKRSEITTRVITDAPQARRLYYHPEYNSRQSTTQTRERNGLNRGAMAGNVRISLLTLSANT